MVQGERLVRNHAAGRVAGVAQQAALIQPAAKEHVVHALGQPAEFPFDGPAADDQQPIVLSQQGKGLNEVPQVGASVRLPWNRTSKPPSSMPKSCKYSLRLAGKSESAPAWLL